MMLRKTPPKREASSSIFRLGTNFQLAGVKLPCFPCPLNSKGGLILPAIDYLSERAVYQRISLPTLVQEAYILKDWFNYCERRSRSWRRPDDKFLHEWRIDLERAKLGRREEDPEGWSRNNRKISVVLRFYHLLQTVLHAFDQPVIGDPGRDDGAERPLTMVLSSDVDEDGEGKPIVLRRVRYGNKPEIRVGRPTPCPAEVAAVIAVVSDRPTDLASSTHHLMARCMAQAGLRAIGVSRLSVTALANALVEDRITPDTQARQTFFDLRAVAGNWLKRTEILDALANLQKNHRKHLFVRVTEKRSVTRNVAFPLELVKELLGYVWEEREQFLTSRAGRQCSGDQDDAVFISVKSGSAYKASSISNLVSNAFRLADVAGSAHRLRAAYAEEIVRDAYLRARATHGRNFDPGAVRLLVQEALGHKSFKTVMAYLNRILTEENLMPGQPILVTREEHAGSVRALVNALNDGDPRVVVTFGQMLEELNLHPSPETSTVQDVRREIARQRKGKSNG